MKQVISASRRTDMPGCYLDRLTDCLKRREALVPNPYSGRINRVDLDPDSVHTLVLWSKNFGPFLENDRTFHDYRLYFLFTINDMSTLEPNIPPLEDRLAQLRELALRYGAERVGWRFDPVVFTHDGPIMIPDTFRRIAEIAVESGLTRCIFSFLNLYGKVKARNNSLKLGIVDPPLSQKQDYASMLLELAGEIGIDLESCCEPEVDVPGIAHSSCIDGVLLSRLVGEPASIVKDSGQRKDCRCTKSRDIGSYRDMPCPHGCRYCYANPVIP